MKIEIEVPEGDVGKSVQEILKNLGWDQKRELCRQIMLEWLSSGIHVNERALHEKDLIEEIRKTEDYYRNKSDADIRESYGFKEKMRSWRSSHEIFVQQTSEEAIRFYKEQVRDIVERDPAIKAMRHEVAQIVKESFPKMLHDAVMESFASNVAVIVQGAMGALRQIPDVQGFTTDVASRLSTALQRHTPLER
jgi:hypothetical protein